MTGPTPPCAILFLLIHGLMLVLGLQSAQALVGDTEGALGLDGSFRIIGALTRNYGDPLLFEGDTDEYLQSILRLTAAGRLSGPAGRSPPGELLRSPPRRPAQVDAGGAPGK